MTAQADKTSRPLVSLCIATYNQEKYVAEAIRSAFSQTYSPLEIIIGDDCSTDATRSIIGHLIEDYKKKDGKHVVHKIVFLQNTLNLGVARNYEQIFGMAQGELIITGAGDDISLPNRVEAIVDYWIRGGRLASVISHGAYLIDENGTRIGFRGAPSAENPVGALMGYTKSVVTDFCPISTRDVFEDDVFSHRAMIIGEILTINQSLMFYRVGTGLSTSGGYHAKRKRVCEYCIRSNGQTWVDLKSKRMQLTRSRYAKLRKAFCDYELMYRCEYRAHSSKKFLRRIGWWRICNRRGGGCSFRRVVVMLSSDRILAILDWIDKKYKGFRYRLQRKGDD